MRTAVNSGHIAGVLASTMIALMLAAFTASVGFGVVLPGACFVLTAGLAVLGFLPSLGMPHLHVHSNSRPRPEST